jgi:hypothetical protein
LAQSRTTCACGESHAHRFPGHSASVYCRQQSDYMLPDQTPNEAFSQATQPGEAGTDTGSGVHRTEWGVTDVLLLGSSPLAPDSTNKAAGWVSVSTSSWSPAATSSGSGHVKAEKAALSRSGRSARTAMTGPQPCTERIPWCPSRRARFPRSARRWLCIALRRSDSRWWTSRGGQCA